MAFIGWKAYNLYRVYDKSVSGADTAVGINTANDAALGNQTILTESNTPKSSQNSIDNSLSPQQFVPTMAERPESKPLYDGIRQVRQYERIAACVKGGKSGCTCYSDQATRLEGITKEMCLDYVENGLPFDPFREPIQSESVKSETTS